MKRAASRQFWQKHIDAQKDNGQSIAAYCRDHNLKTASFHYWRRRLSGDRVAARSAGQAFVPVSIQASSYNRIVLPKGIEIHFDESVSIDRLVYLVRKISEV